MATKHVKDETKTLRQVANEIADVSKEVGLVQSQADFLRTVDMSEAAGYRKPGTIRAIQLDPNGGDWVAEDAAGHRWLITNAVFIENYVRV
jgi:hypothetical protein